jgi:iron uptake system component EfeO
MGGSLRRLIPIAPPVLAVMLILMSGKDMAATAARSPVTQSETASIPIDQAAERYRPELTAAVEQCLAGAQSLRDRLRANDLEGAKKAWIDARVGWERAEVFTSGFTSELDAEIDAWPSAASGFHFIEARLFGAHRMDVLDATDALVFHLSDLRIKIRDTRLTGQGMLEGTAKLAYEIGESKADGGESRFSGTSLDDMRNNADGLAAAYRLVFETELTARDPALAAATNGRIKQLQDQLHATSLAAVDSDKVRTTSEDLVLSLQKDATALGLERPSLSDLAQQ